MVVQASSRSWPPGTWVAPACVGLGGGSVYGWWGSGREATRPPRLGDPSRPRLGSEVGETEADEGWTTAWPRASRGVSSRAPEEASLCPRSPASAAPAARLRLLSAASFDPHPSPEASWVMRRQAPGLWDASEGARRGALSGEEVASWRGQWWGPAGACSTEAASRTVSDFPMSCYPGSEAGQ